MSPKLVGYFATEFAFGMTTDPILALQHGVAHRRRVLQTGRVDSDTKHREHRRDAFEHVRLCTGVSAFGGSCISCVSIINLISAATGTRTTRSVELKRSSPDWGIFVLSGRLRVDVQGLRTAERLLEVNAVCIPLPYTAYRMGVPVASHFQPFHIQGRWVSSGKRSCIPVRCILVQRLIALQMHKCRGLVRIVATIFRRVYPAWVYSR